LPYAVGKGSKEKINILEAMHYIMAVWQQVSQQTIQNCFRKAGHKYQSDGNEMANDDDDYYFGQTGKNCVEPRNTISKAMSQWIAMWQQLALKLLKNDVKHLGLQGVWRKKMKMNKRWCRASPRLMKLYKKLKRFSMRKMEATRTMKTF
jgi:hypothetical protein